jgi:hypothetical protein
MADPYVLSNGVLRNKKNILSRWTLEPCIIDIADI